MTASRQLASIERDHLCAVVVAFHPDAGFERRLAAVTAQVGNVLVVDNTPGGGCAHRLASMASVAVRENGVNLGIATALNQGLEHAVQTGCTWLLTLDQDTLCHTDMVAVLTRARTACPFDAAIVGGDYLDPENPRPRAGAHEFREVKTVITSGCLVNVGMAREIGGFRDDYFIDQVDHEFCLRARAAGQRVIISGRPVMTHSVGRSGGVRLPVLGVMPNHPPQRKYYIARNTIATVRRYWLREPDWCLRRTVRLMLGLIFMTVLEREGLKKARAFAAGFADGWLGRMGPCRLAWLTD